MSQHHDLSARTTESHAVESEKAIDLDDPISNREQVDADSQQSEFRKTIWPWTKFLIWLISLYQRTASGRPSPCRFVPSCSTYATEALESHGTAKGGLLAVWRIMRCNPWGGEGFDPVPRSHRGCDNCDQSPVSVTSIDPTSTARVSRTGSDKYHHQKAH